MIQCEAIEKRESIRFFNRNKKIEKKDIYQCVEAAAKAPSPHNKQPWRFRIVISQDMIKKLMSMLPNNQWIRTASAVVIVGIENNEGIDKLKYYLAAGAAIENLMLEAQQRGISTCWIGECLGKEMEERLLWPQDCEIVSMVAMGYKRESEIKKTIKKNLYDILV